MSCYQIIGNYITKVLKSFSPVNPSFLPLFLSVTVSEEVTPTTLSFSVYMVLHHLGGTKSTSDNCLSKPRSLEIYEFRLVHPVMKEKWFAGDLRGLLSYTMALSQTQEVIRSEYVSVCPTRT